VSTADGCVWSATFQLLACTQCGLTGPLPTNWNLPVLHTLALSTNQLTGPFGQAVAGLPSLQDLNLASNALNDTMSEAWAFDTKPLVLVDLSYNPGITGVLPSSE